MKKIVVALILIGGLVFGLSKNKEVVTVVKSKLQLREQSVQKIVQPELNLVQEVQSEEVGPSLEDIEENYHSFTEKELRAEIAKNERVAQDKQFVAKANANQMDAQTSKEFVAYIRLNAALHKILLTRQLEDVDTEKI